MATKSSVPKCVMCKNPGLLHCAGCKGINYCSVECRDASWRFHKVVCKNFQNSQKPTAADMCRFRPPVAHPEDMYRVLYFPANARKPEFRWVPKMNKPDPLKHTPIDISNMIKADRVIVCHIPGNALDCTSPERPVTIYYDKFHEAYPLNKSVVESTQGLNGCHWGGPIVAAAGEDGEADFDLADFQRLVAWWIRLFDIGTRVTCCSKMVHAVMLPCDGEQRLKGITASQAVKFPVSGLLFKDDSSISEISKRIGMPLLVVEYATKSKAWTEPGDKRNDAMLMHVNSNRATPEMVFVQSAGNSSTVLHLNQDFGNVLVARADLEPLQPEEADAFADFCRSYPMASWMDSAAGKHGQAEEKKYNSPAEAMLGGISPADWAIFLPKWRALKAKKVTTAAKAIEVWKKLFVPDDQATADEEVLRTGLTVGELRDLSLSCLRMKRELVKMCQEAEKQKAPINPEDDFEVSEDLDFGG